MLPIGFAALLGLVLGRFFRVAVLAPGAVATTLFAVFVDWRSGGGSSATFVAVAMAAASLQLGYLVGSATARPAARPRPFSPLTLAKLKASTDL